jgi:uncharacterized SAM-binding protein YcdF (DUF218 family)
MNPQIRESIKTIYDFLALSDIPEKADVIFVACGASIEPAWKAAELYKKGYSKYIFVVGKHGTFSDRSWKEEPALVYKKELLKLNVPGSSLFINPIATNSREEVKMSIEWMKREGVDSKKIIIVDTPKHQMREWATFKKFYHEIKYINVPADEKLVYDQDTLDRVVAEVDRLIQYPSEGKTIEVKIPAKVLKAYEFLKPKIKNPYISMSAQIK